MKKVNTLIFSLISICLLGSCHKDNTYSLKDAAGFEVSNITGVMASESVYQNSAWPISEDAYSYFNCRYIKVDFDIRDEFLSSWPPSELKDDAYCLHVDVKDVDMYTSYGPIFYISHNTSYMYFDGMDATYRSKNKMPNKFIEMIKRDDKRVSNESGEIMNKTLELKIDSTEVEVSWLNNDSVTALKSLSKDGLNVNLEMYGGNEQFGSLGSLLPSSDINQTAIPGDIMLYQSDKIVLFYGSNKWSYTKLGHIILSQDELTNLLGNKDVTITLSSK